MPDIDTLHGRPVKDFTTDAEFDTSNAVIWRVGYDWDNEVLFDELWEDFVSRPDVSQLKGLVIGPWTDDPGDGADAVIDALVARAETLSNLEALFFGDISQEESEISWIEQGDVGKLLNAFPKLKYFGVRGGMGLSLASCEGHETLEELVIETGGLPSEVVNHLVSMKLPALKRLTLWLGSSDYGFDGDVDTYMPLLIGTAFPEQRYPFPALKHLGLQNSEIADELAAALQDAMVLDQLDSLDLSMGVLSDIGLQHLVDNEKLSTLKTLNLSNNYITDMNLVEKIRASGVEVEASGQKRDDDYGRYIDVSE